MTWRLPDTYHSAGTRRGTATLKFYEGRDILREVPFSRFFRVMAGCRHRFFEPAACRGRVRRVSARRPSSLAVAIPDPAASARADAIRRDFTTDAAKINQRWCGDITLPGDLGRLAVPIVIDIASRRVVGSRWPITCVQSWSRTRWLTRSPPATRSPG